MFFRNAASLCLCGLIFSGCSVKEDRDSCPCSLHLTIGGERPPGPVDLAWRIRETDSGSMTAYGEIPAEMTLDVPRCLADLCVTVSEAGCMNDSGGMDIALGDDCPSVFRGRTEADCRSGYAESMISLYKNYSELTCVLEHSGALGPGLDYRITGNVSGYDAYGMPLPGIFNCSLECRKNSSGTFLADVGVPRQIDNSLRLEVSAADGELLRRFALGEYIAASGYDWTAQELEDIVIKINIASTTLSVNVLSGNREIYLSYRL